MFVCWTLSAFAAPKPAPTRGLDVPAPTAAQVSAEGIGVGKYRAVLFSAQDYTGDSGIHDLESPNRDITEIGRVLDEQYGFEVQLVTDATESAIISGLDALKVQAGPDDAVIVYFAGHGLYDEVEKRGFWLPVDAELTNTARWVSNDDVTAKLRAIPARHVLVLIDSCFSGMFRDVDTSWPVEAADVQAAKSLAAKRSRVVISSGSNEPVSDTGRDGMSVFAYYLRDGLLSAKQPFVLPDTLFPTLRERVSQNSPQTPQQGVFHGAYHEGGQIVLLNTKAAAAAAAPPAKESASDAQLACARESKAATAPTDGSTRDAYTSLGAGGWASPAEQLAALTALPTDPKQRERLVYYACLDYRGGFISQKEYQNMSALLSGDPAAKTRLAQAALAEQRRELREVPPPAACDARADESELLVKVNALLKDGTSGAARKEDLEARKLLEAAAKTTSSATVWAAVARARLYAGAPAAEVAAAADKAAAACPAWGVPDSYRGSAWVLGKDLDAAQAGFTMATKKSPDFAFAYYNLALVELTRGRTDGGLAALERALQLDPLLGEAHWLRGRVLLARKDVAGALRSLESAADLRPNNAGVWKSLAEAYTASGDAAQAGAAKKKAESLGG
jgi:tetratricopeptide (TPR) repeat protein